MDRRRFLQLLPVAPLGFLGKAPAAMTYEEELRQILFDSPHLFHFTPTHGPIAVYLDGREVDCVTEFIGSPKPQESVRGAVRTAVLDSEGRIIVPGDDIATEWLIGQVRWDKAVGIAP
jgi:hypothetical protein